MEDIKEYHYTQDQLDYRIAELDTPDNIWEIDERTAAFSLLSEEPTMDDQRKYHWAVEDTDDGILLVGTLQSKHRSTNLGGPRRS